MKSIVSRVGLVVAMAVAVAWPGEARAQEQEVGTVIVTGDKITAIAYSEVKGIEITVSAPGCGVEHRYYRDAQEATLYVEEVFGGLPDGKYTWRATFQPPLFTERPPASCVPYASEQTLVGSYTILNGVLIEDEPEGAPERGASESSGSPTLVSGATSAGPMSLAPESGSAPVPLDFVILDDLIVDGSACIGFDCVNGESFGFDTIRLKENNLRIKFDDTSTASSFPRNDWQITINDSANGGQSKFSVEDITGSRTPFTIEAGARSHSLYVDDGGRIGSRTSTPSVEIHTVDGDTPTLRLQQDGSSGFAPQTWDVAGNETNFFIRDVTNGSALPFRIRPGAPSSAVFIDVNGDVGVGTSSPSSSLHVTRTDGSSKLTVEEGSSTTATRVLVDVKNKGAVIAQMKNTAGTKTWQFGENAAQAFFVRETTGATADEMTLDSAGNMIILGTLTQNSDRNRKDHIVAVNPMEILEKVNNVPISTWTYKENAAVKHLGPMAQDFFDVFGLGLSETSIATIDTSGVALASIQALSKLVEEQRGEAAKKDAQIDELERRLAALESALADRSN